MRLGGAELAHAFPLELDAVGAMDQPVQHGVGDSRMPEHCRMPLLVSG